MKFQNRKEAGQNLAQQLQDYKNHSDCLVLALPRGGVPVALEIAKELNIKMDVFLVRKIGFPGNEEYAMGAIAEGDVIIWNDEVMQNYNISEDIKKSAIATQQEELKRRIDLYRHGKSEIQIKNKTIILVDDGLATGSTMIAAIKALRKKGAAKIIAALPVGPEDTDFKLRLADKIICLYRTENFFGVGQFYENFGQIDDAEVVHDLQEAEKLII